MTSAEPAPTGPALRAYLALRHAIPLVAPLLLRRRLRRGKEDAGRWREKLGEATLTRPEGALVWMHAVGLGEVLALRGLIAAMAAARGDLRFLVTSSTRTSAAVFAANCPPRTQHQFLPLDAPGYTRRFLDHWRPDLSVWAEQDLWPGLVVETRRRGIPLALVNARMDARAFAARARVRGLFGNLYRRFGLIAAQDDATARHLGALGAADVRVSGSLKPAAPALADAPGERARIAALLAGRRVWLAASSHPGDEAVALAAHAKVRAADPSALLIVAPRLVDRADEIDAACVAAGFSVARRSAGQDPTAQDAVWLADTFGEMGLWYRLVDAALIGGAFGPVNGHNPWEAAQLGAAVLHGPKVANFAADYAALHRAQAACEVTDAGGLAALLAGDLTAMADRAKALAEASAGAVTALADDLLNLMEARHV